MKKNNLIQKINHKSSFIFDSYKNFGKFVHIKYRTNEYINCKESA